MRNNYRSKSFKAWLDKLQQESWQLELIISGFSIYGLSQVFEPLKIALSGFENQKNIVVLIASMIALISCYILMFTLLIHVILRGLWIGALGLRYISGDIDYKKLNYRPKFDRYLRKKIGSFDKYISRLEDYCSVLFAISFLLIFYILSIFLIIGALAAIGYFLVSDEVYTGKLPKIIGGILMAFILIGVLLTFIDFVTQGFLKKKKWLAIIYFPFYWVFSYLTLSVLYRPLVYNFLDNKFGKRLSLILIPIYFLVIAASSYNYNRSNYLSSGDASNLYRANILNYDENITEKGMFIRNASIPSKIITTHYLPVFIEYNDNVENAIFNFNIGLKPDDDIRGFKSGIVFNNYDSDKNIDSLKTEYMKTLSKIYSFKIDSLDYKNPDFLFTKHLNKQDGFETVLPLKKLKQGKHLLSVYRSYKKDSVIMKTTIITLPFWYYKE